MNIDNALNLFAEFESDSFVQNLIAQSNAKNILLEVKEPEENHPSFTEGLDERITSIAFTYLSIGCALRENGENSDIASAAFEKAGDIIHYINSPDSINHENSNFLLVISSLSFYLATQYSKSFIVIKKVEVTSPLISLVSFFLKKDFKNLLNEINKVQLNDEYLDDSISQLGGELERNNKYYTAILSKALNLILEYIYSGKEEFLAVAQDHINDIKQLSSIDDEPVTWWIARLLIILINTFKTYSFWNVLPKLIEHKITDNYVTQLALNDPPITEMFYAQYNAVQAMQISSDIVLSLPTSSGKTRIAEVAILEALVNNPLSKVLYLAPFRSLSYEVEESMDKMFSPLGFTTTLLYGGGQYSKLDKALIENSNVIIATPEKAKAIIRADEDIANGIDLLIIDEGHLLGADERLIKIELFIEELKHHIKKNDGKIILLSAVLPNTKDISKWISNDENNIYETDKTIANKRFGIAKWTHAKNINIEWLGEPKSFNQNFIKKFLPPKARTKYFPDVKSEGIASLALKLSQSGTVLLFVAQARYVLTSARRVLKAMGGTAKKHSYRNVNLLETFKLACCEAGVEEIFKLAEYGVLCHFGKLPTEVRVLIEQLMRSEKVKVIVSTSSLGQGVNIGISTVIFSDVFMNHQEERRIGSKDFWNIAGRAGRAFSDIEGKVLYCIDETNWSKERDLQLCASYFDFSKMEHAQSGLLAMIKTLKNVAARCKVSFDLLLELVADNDFSRLKEGNNDYSSSFIEIFDWLDDTLLALDYKNNASLSADPSSWIDDVFRCSLAHIQAEKDEDVSQDKVIEFLKSRNKAVIKMAGDPSNWEGIVKSGIPLSSSSVLDNYIEHIKEITALYNDSDKDVSNLIELSKGVENLIQQMPTVSFKHAFDEEEINKVRKKWFSAAPLSEITDFENGQEICVSYFSMTLPWAINAIVRKLYDLDLEDEAELIEELALYCEIGVPNMDAIQIYLAGIKSRVAALDLSNVLNDKTKGVNKSKLLDLLNKYALDIELKCSDTTLKWVELFNVGLSNEVKEPITEIVNFTLAETTKSDILNVRGFNDGFYLCSPNFEDKVKIKSSKDLPFKDVSNNPKVFFGRDGEIWKMKIRGELGVL
ncbi:DEAD/DEAH box helicase [Agarivorans sp. TSD2052]|uniref:DEAD/DEAH box helicase n=1 Tax=Agarivorans sp. TSD2052 TaxID=2937286 RepID=UPI0020103EC5|nr:DEAD/DEAH box helicase [Agarivorans sp. TSD2052]UPW20123.1 DEAD/DEAH box helicase [Agarivorans sp. TSD2052]